MSNKEISKLKKNFKNITMDQISRLLSERKNRKDEDRFIFNRIPIC